MYLPDPYPARNIADVKRLTTYLDYPINVVRLVYSQFEKTVHDKSSPFDLWLHPGQYNTSYRRSNGHDVLRELLRTGLLCNTATFHDLRYYTIYPIDVPRDWYQYSHIIGWKGLAYNQYGDMVVPALYTKNPHPTIHWISLSLIMHAGEVTLLYESKQGD